VLGLWPVELPLSVVNTSAEPATWQLAVRIEPACSGTMPAR
jgi:hypothetical protein